jgi:hypothetical protein
MNETVIEIVDGMTDILLAIYAAVMLILYVLGIHQNWHVMVLSALVTVAVIVSVSKW